MESADWQATFNSIQSQNFGKVEIFCCAASSPCQTNGVFYSRDLNEIANQISCDFFILLYAGEILKPDAFFTIYRELFARGVDVLLFENNHHNAYPLFGSDSLIAYFFAAPNLKKPPFWATSANVAQAALQNAGENLHKSALPFYLLLLITYFGHSLDFAAGNILQKQHFQNTLAAEDFAVFAQSMRKLAENLHAFIGHFAASDAFLNAADSLPQKIAIFYADSYQNAWLLAWQKEWQGFENAETFKIATHAFSIRFVDWRGSRTEKVGKVVLFPFKILRSLIWHIEKNATGRILMKPFRYLWRIFYGIARKTYHFARFLRNIQNANTR